MKLHLRAKLLGEGVVPENRWMKDEGVRGEKETGVMKLSQRVIGVRGPHLPGP